MKEGSGGRLGESRVAGKIGDRLVDRLGGLVVVEIVQPALGRSGEELAARDPESLRRRLDALEGLVGKRNGRLHDISITRSYPAWKRVSAPVRDAADTVLVGDGCFERGPAEEATWPGSPVERRRSRLPTLTTIGCRRLGLFLRLRVADLAGHMSVGNA